MPRPFRFGAQISRARAPWIETARKGEDLGYSTLFMPDHFGDQLAPVPALMAAADATTELRVGSLVFDNDYKHPVVLAKEMATHRRALRRPGRARHRRRLDDDRLRAVRHPVRPARRARRPHGRGHRRHQGAVRRRAVRASRASTTRSPATTARPSRCRSRTRRSSSAAAASGCCRIAAARGRHRRHQPQPARRRGRPRDGGRRHAPRRRARRSVGCATRPATASTTSSSTSRCSRP